MKTCTCGKPITIGSKSGLCRVCSAKLRWEKKKSKKIKIVIPTYNRIEKVKRLIASIKNQNVDCQIIVWADNDDIKTVDLMKQYYSNEIINEQIQVLLENNRRSFQIGIWNLFYTTYQDWDGAFLLCDDVELLPNCLENAIKCWEMNFPDGDGIIGLTQVYPNQSEAKWVEAGQILIGKKFVERFKEVDYQVHCPNYYFFQQDLELEAFSKSINKFKLCNEARLIHHHPCRYPNEMDTTHAIPRSDIKIHDMKIAKKRKGKGLIWGNSFELIKENEL